MKRLLIASTAIAGLAISAPSALAQDGISVGGYGSFWMDLSAPAPVEFDNKGEKTEGESTTPSYYRGEMEAAINASQEQDNGWVTGASVQLRVNNDGEAGADKGFIFMEAGFGKLEMGYADSVIDVLAIEGGDVGSTDTTSNLGGLFLKQADNLKLNYFSPEFSGFKFGLTLAQPYSYDTTDTIYSDDCQATSADGDDEDADTPALTCSVTDEIGEKGPTDFEFQIGAQYAIAGATLSFSMNTQYSIIGIGAKYGLGPLTLGFAMVPDYTITSATATRTDSGEKDFTVAANTGDDARSQKGCHFAWPQLSGERQNAGFIRLHNLYRRERSHRRDGKHRYGGWRRL